MMFILDGKKLKLDRPFTHKGLQYPKEWLRCSTPDQKKELGIIEVPNNTPAEQWDMDKERVRKRLIEKMRKEAKNILSDTDWMVIRELETGEKIPPEVSVFRQFVRELCSQHIESLKVSADPSATWRGLKDLPVSVDCVSISVSETNHHDSQRSQARSSTSQPGEYPPLPVWTF